VTAVTHRLFAGVLALAVGLPATAPAQQGTSAADTVAQVDLPDVLRRLLGKRAVPTDSAAPREAGTRTVISVLPAFSVNPATGFLLGVSGNVVSRLGPTETTNLSFINAGATYSSLRQLNLSARSNVFLAGNRIKFEGDWRYLDTSQPTFGLGRAQAPSAPDSMKFKEFRFFQTVYVRAGTRLLLGPGYLLDHHFGIVDQNANASQRSPVVEYEGRTVANTTASGVSLNALIDTRDNPIYPTSGVLAYASARAFPRSFGSTKAWRELQLELRAFKSIDAATNHVLALWGFARATGGAPPYLDLPALGWDTNNRSGRGYLQGRVRGVHLVYGEAEYRVTLTRNGLLGAVTFLNAISVADATSRRLQSANLGGGAGLRIKLNKRSRSNIALDYGFGAVGSRGFFLGASEAF
jgi:hypothetical protein